MQRQHGSLTWQARQPSQCSLIFSSSDTGVIRALDRIWISVSPSGSPVLRNSSPMPFPPPPTRRPRRCLFFYTRLWGVSHGVQPCVFYRNSLWCLTALSVEQPPGDDLDGSGTLSGIPHATEKFLKCCSLPGDLVLLL